MTDNEKKIRILTFHGADNYGAVLQAYALQEYLTDTFHADVKILNYLPHRFQYEDPKLLEFGKGMRTLLKGIYTYKIRKRRHDSFRQFREKYMILDNYTNIENENIDIYFVGSDQVWNSDLNGEDTSHYFLDFVDKGKKVSFAASFGKDRINAFEEKLIGQYLSSFFAISVRENSAKMIMKEYGLNNVEVVCDPVFLIDRSYYDEIKKNSDLSSEKYVLIYTLEYNTNAFAAAQSYADKYNLKIYSIGMGKNVYHTDKHYKGISVEEYIYLVSNAECVITNSFHTIAFSVIYHRNFCYIPLMNGRGSRITDLLQTIDLNACIYSNKNSVEDINYSRVDKLLNEYIGISKDFLYKVVED